MVWDMTKQELIKLLEPYDDDMIVLVPGYENGYDAIDINILAIKLINIQNTIASQRIVQGLVDNEIDFEFADFLTNKIPLLSFDYSNNEVLEYTNILIF